MHSLEKTQKNGSKVTGIAIVVIVHIGLAFAFFGCSEPARMVARVSMPVETRIIEEMRPSSLPQMEVNVSQPTASMSAPAYIPMAEQLAQAPMLSPPTTNKFPGNEVNPAVLVEERPVSTFSIDVDTASYAYVRRLLSAGILPPAEAVRIEEMVNYFPYQYATPANPAQPFGISTEVMPSPWQAGNQLVHIAVRGYDIAAAKRPPVNVVLLIDVSGSMEPDDRLPLLKRGFRMFASQLRDEDRVAIVTYANDTKVVLAPTSGRDKAKVIQAIEALGSGGGTNGGDGLAHAYALAERNFDAKAVNRVILATDGDFNIGNSDPDQLEKFIAKKRKTGVYLSIFGVGDGNLNDELIQRLTQAGNGNAAYIDSVMEARKAMHEELGSTMFPIANDVKVQVEFNPKLVAGYRLIGYETRMLERQDFKDDKVDAGDMGAGHSVTAIYEITPVGARGKLVDPLRYGKKSAKHAASAAEHGKGELCFVKLRYKLPGEASSSVTKHVVHAASARKSMDAVPEEQRFAVAVAAFGQRLRAEKNVSDFSYAEIAKLANTGRGQDPFGYRAEFVKLVRTAEGLSH
ncbi:MAG: von Willebrand factor type A domain-containing protein [Pseudomonadota bacterium]